jgi:hypothetical protein
MYMGIAGVGRRRIKGPVHHAERSDHMVMEMGDTLDIVARLVGASVHEDFRWSLVFSFDESSFEIGDDHIACGYDRAADGMRKNQEVIATRDARADVAAIVHQRSVKKHPR